MSRIPRMCSRSETVIIFSILFLSLTAPLLFYIYMGIPGEASLEGYTAAEPEDSLVREERSGRMIRITGRYTARNQNPSRQLRKEIVLMGPETCFSYPVQYTQAPDAGETYGSRPARSDSGFSLQINSRFLGKGRYRLYIRYVYDNKKFMSDLKKELIVE